MTASRRYRANGSQRAGNLVKVLYESGGYRVVCSSRRWEDDAGIEGEEALYIFKGVDAMARRGMAGAVGKASTMPRRRSRSRAHPKPWGPQDYLVDPTFYAKRFGPAVEGLTVKGAAFDRDGTHALPEGHPLGL